MDAIRHKLVQMGYEGAEQVESPGQFAVRGSIIDIYTLTDEVPYRIDMWDDEVDIILKNTLVRITAMHIYTA